MSVDINQFTEEILGIVPTYSSVNPFGPGIQLPVVGSRGIVPGSPSNDLVNSLRQAAVEFAEAYKKDNTTEEQLNKLAEKIEGPLMMEETLSILSKQKVDYLVDTLQRLMEAKYGPEHN